MTKPLVSILMSVFNGEQTLNRCIDSLLNQSYQHFEFIIVNDGSADNTKDILQSYSDQRLKIYDLPHIGLVKALNFGLEKCRGKYIARMDADDYCHPNRLEKQVDYLEKHISVDVISCLVTYAGNRNKQLGYALHVDWMNELTSHEDIVLKRFQDSPLANPSCMFRSRLISEYGNYSEDDIPEDYEFWLRLLHHNRRFAKIEEQLFFWSDLPTRLTRNSSNYDQDAFYKVKTKYLAMWIEDSFTSMPEIFIFGTGKSVYAKTKFFNDHGLSISGFVEVK
ncbi:glycosyltransferase, partial [Fulvivirga sp. RKSG066]|uniref:glycosyltransferase n=1 Tax=Fulvivirga aurantia TaxID=2529383 RepID=UPI0012BC2724|nr:glycosyltransferase [Fulvivirga aurantia]